VLTNSEIIFDYKYGWFWA